MSKSILIVFVLISCTSDYRYSACNKYPLYLTIEKNDGVVPHPFNLDTSKISMVVKIYNFDTLDVLLHVYKERNNTYISFGKIYFSGLLPNVTPYLGPYLVIEKEYRSFLDTIKPREKKAYLVDDGLNLNDSTNYVIFIPHLNSSYFNNLNKTCVCEIGNKMKSDKISHPFFGFNISTDSVFTDCTDALLTSLQYIKCHSD